MTVKIFPEEKQPKELLAYLGVRKGKPGWRYLLACMAETADGCEPGIAVYNRVGQALGLTATKVLLDSQCALNKAQQKNPQEWAEIFPWSKSDGNRIGLTTFLRRASAWLSQNRIGYTYMTGGKCRVLVPKPEEDPAAE